MQAQLMGRIERYDMRGKRVTAKNYRSGEYALQHNPDLLKVTKPEKASGSGKANGGRQANGGRMKKRKDPVKSDTPLKAEDREDDDHVVSSVEIKQELFEGEAEETGSNIQANPTSQVPSGGTLYQGSMSKEETVRECNESTNEASQQNFAFEKAANVKKSMTKKPAPKEYNGAKLQAETEISGSSAGVGTKDLEPENVVDEEGYGPKRRASLQNSESALAQASQHPMSKKSRKIEVDDVGSNIIGSKQREVDMLDGSTSGGDDESSISNIEAG